MSDWSRHRNLLTRLVGTRDVTDKRSEARVPRILEGCCHVHRDQSMSGIVPNFNTSGELLQNCVGLGCDHEKPPLSHR